MKKWLKDHKEDLLVVWGSIGTVCAIILLVYSIAVSAMASDLVNVVNSKDKEIEKLTKERNHYFYLSDDLAQTYEDVVPKAQYVQDIEYLELVILELRDKCESYNNKDN
jgi:hypothetical protein